MKKAVKRWFRRGIAIVFVLAVVAMLVMAWMPKPVPVDVATVERG